MFFHFLVSAHLSISGFPLLPLHHCPENVSQSSWIILLLSLSGNHIPFIYVILLYLLLHLAPCSCIKDHFQSHFFQRAFSESPRMDLASIIHVCHTLETSKTVVNIVYLSAPFPTGLSVFEQKECFMFRFISLPSVHRLDHSSYLVDACLRIMYGRKINTI